MLLKINILKFPFYRLEWVLMATYTAILLLHFAPMLKGHIPLCYATNLIQEKLIPLHSSNEPLRVIPVPCPVITQLNSIALAYPLVSVQAHGVNQPYFRERLFFNRNKGKHVQVSGSQHLGKVTTWGDWAKKMRECQKGRARALFSPGIPYFSLSFVGNNFLIV